MTGMASARFAEEEIGSAYRYLSGYAKAKPIAEQVVLLHQLFPGLGDADEALAGQPLPRAAEGYFAIPRWQCIASTYNQAFQIVLDLLENSRDGNFFNNRAGQTGPEGLRQLQRTEAAFDAMSADQLEKNVLVVPAQFALRHRGRSVRRAREVFASNEFGLGAFHVGIMLLTHPERLQQYDDLYVDAAGDEFDDAAADNRFGRTPCFCFEHGKLEFGTHWTDRAYDFNGSASAFMPTSVPTAALPPRRAQSKPTGQFAAEEVESPYGYLSGFRKPKPLADQVASLREHFPDIGPPIYELAEQPFPENAEGWFAIPRCECLAPTYNEALERALDTLKTARDGRFFNYRRGRLGPEVLRQHEQTSAAMGRLSAAQQGRDVVVVPAQFGLRHRGRSIRRARQVFAPNEFGLGAYHVAMMLLTHPERLHHYDDLWPDCPGDEYDDVNRPERYGRAPRFIFDGGQEEFGTHWINRPEDSDGSVTGFEP